MQKKNCKKINRINIKKIKDFDDEFCKNLNAQLTAQKILTRHKMANKKLALFIWIKEIETNSGFVIIGTVKIIISLKKKNIWYYKCIRRF